MGDKLDIITIGESLIELSSNQSLAYAQTLEKYYGGDTLCTAVAAMRLGSKAGYITRLEAFVDLMRRKKRAKLAKNKTRV